ncbi:hypothetical protein FA95DRAFT_227041 [Auriscalpium vulgare]|uniref:Uncharacterized protein n=1 Tax=Auriscalpium vulgare TaxID=40419 RepID=A0ACB8RKM0_9AGAM|nr:hypothetical protein FA95DRAFT_227041 [Auriscalpium vulgare]
MIARRSASAIVRRLESGPRNGHHVDTTVLLSAHRSIELGKLAEFGGWAQSVRHHVWYLLSPSLRLNVCADFTHRLGLCCSSKEQSFAERALDVKMYRCAFIDITSVHSSRDHLAVLLGGRARSLGCLGAREYSRVPVSLNLLSAQAVSYDPSPLVSIRPLFAHSLPSMPCRNPSVRLCPYVCLQH